MKKFVLVLLNLGLIISTACASENFNNENFYKKYNKEVQKSIYKEPKINEVSMGNNQLVVRSKNNKEEEKWGLNYYPFYWKKIGTIDLDNSYINIQTSKTGFAENKLSLNALEYKEDGAIIGFVKTDVLKNSKAKKKIIGFKYNLDNAIDKNDKAWQVANLQYVVLFDADIKNNEYVQLVYNSNGNLPCSQINNKMYVNSENKNLLVETKDLDLEANEPFIKTFIKSIRKATSNAFSMFVWFIKGD